jgi:hypothetical protein
MYNGMSKDKNDNKNGNITGDPNTFNIFDPCCNDLVVRRSNNLSLNRYLFPFDDCKEEKLRDNLKLFTDTEELSYKKRSRSSDSLYLVMNDTNPRPNKQQQQILSFVDRLDSNSTPPITPPCKPYYKESFRDYVSHLDHYSPYSDGYFSPSPPLSPMIMKEYITIKQEINSLKDLLDLIDNNPIAENVEYNIDLTTLNRIKPHLLELNNMIGMNGLKNHVVDQILYYLQGFHKKTDDCDFMHTVIYGPPGTGKTEVAKIIGKIFSKLGVLSKDKFTKATRSDLIAGYLGQTALKTRDMINESLGGVLFIDEAYALGNDEKRDSFAKECIDTLCEGLSDHKADLMVIVAGYEEELKTCFFSYNQGLDSRFTWRFKTDDYKPEELRLILEKKISDANWSTEKNALTDDWFIKNKVYFQFYGRDMETLFSKIKIAHSRRVFCLPEDKKTIVTLKDIESGMEMFLQNEEVKKRGDVHEFRRNLFNTMYS